MNPIRPPRLAAWLPGAALLAAAIAIGAGGGFAFGVKSWPVYLGLTLAALLAMGWVEKLWGRRTAPRRPPAARGRLKVIRGGKSYDLEKDDSTNNQRYLM
jgi:hypothetical protein